MAIDRDTGEALQVGNGTRHCLSGVVGSICQHRVYHPANCDTPAKILVRYPRGTIS